MNFKANLVASIQKTRRKQRQTSAKRAFAPWTTSRELLRSSNTPDDGQARIALQIGVNDIALQQRAAELEERTVAEKWHDVLGMSVHLTTN